MSRDELLHNAAALLESEAHGLKESHSLSNGEWYLVEEADHGAKRSHDEMLEMARGLRGLATPSLARGDGERETLLAASRKLELIGQIYAGDKESRRLAKELSTMAEVATPTPPSAEGEYVMVPREPTKEWAEAFCHRIRWDPNGEQSRIVKGLMFSATFRDIALDYIRAMIRSAPVPAAPVSTERMDVRKLYDELLLAVSRKWPGESRHDTALRYIRAAEQEALSPQPQEDSNG